MKRPLSKLLVLVLLFNLSAIPTFAEDTSGDPCIQPDGSYDCENVWTDYNEDHEDDEWEEDDWDDEGDWEEDSSHGEADWNAHDDWDEKPGKGDPCVDATGMWVCDDEWEWEWEDDEDDYVDHYHDQVRIIGEELYHLEMVLKDAEELASLLRDAPVEINDSVEAIEIIADKGFELMDKMQDKVERGLSVDEVDAFWESLEQLMEMAEEQMEAIIEKVDVEFEYEEDFDDLEDHFGGHGDFFEAIDPENVDHIKHYIPTELLEELMHHPGSQELAMHVMNNLDVLGEEAAQMLEYSADLFALMEEVNVPDEDDPKYDRLKDLFDHSFVLLTADVRADLMTKWTEIKVAVEAGASEAQLEAFADEVEALLDVNEQELVLDEGIGYYDVDVHTADWYFDDVQELREGGVISGFKDDQGNLTGYFGPGQDITKAEMLKLILEVSGIGPAGHTPSDTSAHGQWFQGYVAQFEAMGLPYGGDWNTPASRREAAVWMSHILDLDEKAADYEGEFVDVDTYDEDADHFAGAYHYGIFTGDDGVGTLRPDEQLNRAEAAKTIFTAMEEVVDKSSENVDAQLDELLNTI